MLIGITGYAQHGKDTIGARLESHYGFTRMAFADSLKELAVRANPWIERYDFPKHPTRLGSLVELTGWEKTKERAECRRFLQELGVGARQLIGGDVWIRALENKWLDRHPANTVITDVRFPNEADWIHRHNGLVIRVTRYEHTDLDPFAGEWRVARYVDPSHESERWITHIKADYDLTNDSTKRDLEFKVDRFMETMKKEGWR